MSYLNGVTTKFISILKGGYPIWVNHLFGDATIWMTYLFVGATIWETCSMRKLNFVVNFRYKTAVNRNFSCRSVISSFKCTKYNFCPSSAGFLSILMTTRTIVITYARFADMVRTDGTPLHVYIQLFFVLLFHFFFKLYHVLEELFMKINLSSMQKQ